MKRTKRFNWLWFGMILTLTACGGGGDGGGGESSTPTTTAPTTSQASVVVGGRAGSATQLSSLVASSARSNSAMKSVAADPLDPALANAKVTLEVIKVDDENRKYYTVTDENGAYSIKAKIDKGDKVTVTFEKEGYTTFTETLDTSGTTGGKRRQFVVDGKSTETSIFVQKTGSNITAAGAGDGSSPGFRFGLMRDADGVQRAFASGSEVRRAIAADPILDIIIPGAWAPGNADIADADVTLTAKLAAFDPSDPNDRSMFPGEFVGVGGGLATGAAANKAEVAAEFQLESVSFFSADVTLNTGNELTTTSSAAAAGLSKAAVWPKAKIYKQIPAEGCKSMAKYADKDKDMPGVQVPLYTYQSSTGKWGYLGNGTLATYNNDGSYNNDPKNDTGATISLKELKCDNTNYYYEIETAEWTTWWNLDYPISLEKPNIAKLSGTVVDQKGNPIPGAYVVADGYKVANGANSYHSAYANNDGRFELKVDIPPGKTLDHFAFSATDQSSWPNAVSTFLPPADPSTTASNPIGDIVIVNPNTGTIVGTLLTADSKPIADQTIWVESIDKTKSNFYKMVQTDASGNFSLRAPTDLALNIIALGNSYPATIDGVVKGYESADEENKVLLKPIQKPNAPPIVSTWIKPNPAKAGKDATLSAWAWDPEGDEPLRYQWKQGARILSNASEFIWSQLDAGTHTLEVVVTDSKGNSKSTTQILTVSPSDNSVPVITKADAVAATSCGGSPTITVKAYDPDGDVLTFNLGGTNYPPAADGTITEPFAAGNIGLTVTDTKGGSNTKTISIPSATQFKIYTAEYSPVSPIAKNAVELFAYAYAVDPTKIYYEWSVTDSLGKSVTPVQVVTGSDDRVKFTPAVAGDYKIELTSGDTCSSDVRSFQVRVAPEAVKPVNVTIQ